jgi:flavin reductase (DIM6/NTAB) family NADH-FMN oxidoreductase RutF
MTFDVRAFRQALGSFPTGVAVITTSASAEHHMGITVNSFTSVSLDPPLVLWCLDKKSDRYHAFTKARSYTVSILGTEHQDVSSRLAKQGSHNLDGIGLSKTTLGPPSLAEALAVFDCEADAVHDAADHSNLIRRVLRNTRHGYREPIYNYRPKNPTLSQAS